MIIKDGSGFGYSAKVDSENRFYTLSTMLQFETTASLNQKAFLISTGKLTLTATGGQILWLTNENSSQLFRPTRFLMSWNGGSTNHNRVCEAQMLIGDDTAPTANHTEVTPANTYCGSNVPALMSAYKWSGTADGMTGTVNQAGCSLLLSQGYSEVPVTGIIIQNGASIGLNVIPEEAGDFSIAVFGHYHEEL